MKFNRVFLFILAALVSTLLTACGAVPLNNWPGMTSDGKNVYLADGQFVYTVQVSTGQEVTTRATDGTTIPMRFPAKVDSNIAVYGVPAITSDGQLIFGNASTLTNVYTLYSINAATGVTNWSFLDAKSTWMAGATVNAKGDAIYAANSDGKLYAFDLKGKKLWESAVSTDAVWSSPVSDGKLVYIGTLSHEIIALDPATGVQRWKKTLDNAIIGPPAIGADGNLYVGTISGNLYAFNATEGSQLWLVQLQGGVWSTPQLDGTTLYVGTSIDKAGKFYAIDSTTGRFLRSPIDETGAIIASPLITKDQVIYVTEDGYIKFLDKKGAPSATAVKIENAKIYTTPMLVGDYILVAPMNAEFVLAAYNQQGVQQWKFVPVK